MVLLTKRRRGVNALGTAASSAGAKTTGVKLPAKRGFTPPTRQAGETKEAAASGATEAATDTTPASSARHFEVLYCKFSNKKRKSYMDGVMTFAGKKATLRAKEDGKVVSSTFTRLSNIKVGEVLLIGSFEAEVTAEVSNEAFESGALFLSASAAAPAAPSRRLPSLPAYTRPTLTNPSKRRRKELHGVAADGAPDAGTPSTLRLPEPRHSPTHPDAIVLNERAWRAGKEVAVVVDPLLCSRLRPHQREGVRFLYSCVDGQEVNGVRYCGCVLADEMGLGKTLQSITLLWTLLKQGPRGVPTARRAVIVCPSSLVENWAREIKKWLGNERLRPVCGRQQRDFHDFQHGSGTVFPVLIVSYEMYRKFKDAIHSVKPGLLICDEGHRLKNSAGNKTIAALGECPTGRRVVLTGTPVQNDLEEFYAVLSFVNPGVLGDKGLFSHIFAGPISKGRDKGATEEEAALARARAEQLNDVTSRFLLRRDASILRKHLPPKTEAVVFCRPLEGQLARYRELLQSEAVVAAVCGRRGAATSDPLQLILQLRMLCIHPRLGSHEEGSGGGGSGEGGEEGGGSGGGGSGGRYRCPALSAEELATSAKLRVLRCLLTRIRAAGDRVVVVSSFTSALDVVGQLCDAMDMGYLRLDGSTDAGKRQELVNRFNSPYCGAGAFLLSSRAGGVGLNLIGANRLVMLDADWNPAVDNQAKARVWRDGQRKRVTIYRLLLTGTIEEKIYLRQILKLDIASAVGAHGSSKGGGRGKRASNPTAGVADPGKLSSKDLRELFKLNERTDCETFDLLSTVPGAGWNAYGGAESISDEVLRGLATELPDAVSFVHEEHTDAAEAEDDEASAAAAAAAAVLDEGAEEAGAAAGIEEAATPADVASASTSPFPSSAATRASPECASTTEGALEVDGDMGGELELELDDDEL